MFYIYRPVNHFVCSIFLMFKLSSYNQFSSYGSPSEVPLVKVINIQRFWFLRCLYFILVLVIKFGWIHYSWLICISSQHFKVFPLSSGFPCYRWKFYQKSFYHQSIYHAFVGGLPFLSDILRSSLFVGCLHFHHDVSMWMFLCIYPVSDILADTFLPHNHWGTPIFPFCVSIIYFS